MENSKVSITRLLKSDTGHRVFGHEGKCKHPHGHEYKYEITACANDLDELGRVIDFSAIKNKLGRWIDDNWDHSFLVYEKDHQLINALSSITDSKKPVVVSWNPTAENMAIHLIEEVCPLLFRDANITITKIRVWETENCYAEVEL